MMAKGWFVERKRLDCGGWDPVFAGYDTEKQARAAAAREAKIWIFAIRWRVGRDEGAGRTPLLEAKFIPGGRRAKWTPVEGATT